MPTAPSFCNYKVITSTPFVKNGKSYITVEHPKTGNRRDVRWYTDAEYAKLYNVKAEINLKKARGFSNGPILLIRNAKPSDTEWLYKSNARYATDVGWYIVSTEELPADAPKHFKYFILTWDEFQMATPISSILKQKQPICII